MTTSKTLLALAVSALLGSASLQAEEAKNAANDAQETKGWQVNQPQGEFKTVTISTSQGTWMNVDVSPDGKTLVFDLLGDIYTMPMSGGTATALTNDIAWNMQPRFSPDGKQIAFTSDQGGGDNLWIMDLDGSNAQQVTNESFRLLNSPAWSPDGEFLVGRKHFTGTRSLGAGEIWLY
ncbi:MAG: PD40 domain-containing protein, partial [Alkalimonas sp.]|nr:PD40 domain-containing protein [Alkalimonas sp.]